MLTTNHTNPVNREDAEYKALGKHVTIFEGFDTFPCPPGIGEVTMTSDEVTALCPVTGQPDWYIVSIEYKPNALCIESKSLKLYLQSFRNDGLFCEAFAARIAEDISEAIKPASCKVTVVQKPRGGVSITAVAAIIANKTAADMEVKGNG